MAWVREAAVELLAAKGFGADLSSSLSFPLS
jgi:hypothetical protein